MMIVRLDTYLQEAIEKQYHVKLSRSYIDRLLESGAVIFNDEIIKKKGYTINTEKTLPTIDEKKVNAMITVYQTGKRQDTEAVQWDASEEGIELDEDRIKNAADLTSSILLETDDIVAIFKPPGVSSHPGKGDQGSDSMVYQFIKYMRTNHQYAPRAGLLHRLDKDTRGVLLFAKNMQTYNQVKQQFEQRNIEKYYLATCDKTPRVNNSLKRVLAEVRKLQKPLVYSNVQELITGAMERHKPLELEGFIGKQKTNQYMLYTPDSRESGRLVGSKSCVSDVYIVDETPEKIKLLFVPHTGRTHQIRAQARFLGAPVVNDRVYGISRTPTGMLGLCAIGITFTLNGEKISVFPELNKI